jgi:hypothetical protein
MQTATVNRPTIKLVAALTRRVKAAVYEITLLSVEPPGPIKLNLAITKKSVIDPESFKELVEPQAEGLVGFDANWENIRRRLQTFWKGYPEGSYYPRANVDDDMRDFPMINFD